MELCIDLKEITRIPYHELETVYFSINITVLPYGKRFFTGPSYGEKSIKFRPHRFKFFINDIENSQFSLTVLSHLTDNRFYILSYLKIPLISVPINGYATKSFETEPLHQISISPIAKLTIGINIDYSIEKSLNHTNIIDNIEYEKYESPPVFQLDCFGKLKPPKQYLDSCSKLIEQDPDLFLNLISNDKLRKYVLDKVSEYYKNIEDISFLFEIEKKKKKEISLFPQKEFAVDTKKVKFKKDLENGTNLNNQKNKVDRLQQPSIEPKIPRIEDQKIDINQMICKNKVNSDLNNEIVSSINKTCNSIGISLDARAFSLNPNIRSKIQTKSLSSSVTDSPTTLTQNSQFQKPPQQSKHQMSPQQPKIKLQYQQPQKYQQQAQQQQNQKIRNQPSQQPLQVQSQTKSQQPPAKPLQLPNQPQIKQSQPISPHHPPQSSNHQIQTQPSTAEKVIKKMFVNIDKNQSGMPMKRGIFPDKSQMPAKKPKPPTPNQYPTLVDSSNPRRKQISDF